MQDEVHIQTRFRPFKLILFVGGLMLAVSLYMRWHTQTVSLPRYCESPPATLAALRAVISEQKPAGEGDRKPFLIAAKLLYIIPRSSDESAEEYLFRIRIYLDEQCR